MGVLKTVTCPECGTPTRAELTRGRLEGLCPGCLVAVATATPAAVAPRGPQARPIPAWPPEVAKADPAGRLGRFVPVSKLGAGSSGEVWKAWDTALGRWVALKVFHEDDPEELARFTREAETAAKLSHPNIAAIYDVGSDKGRHYLAMQYVEGVTLHKFPRRNVNLLVQVVRDAARAVAEAHRMGIVHRDLKPANLAVASHGENPGHPHVYVLDFGLARRIEGGDKVTATGIVVGTPAYMAPEQARGERADGRADVYALGATLFELLTRRPVFRGSSVYEVLRKVEELEPPSPRRLVASIPRDVETIVLRCLEKDPARRYGTCAGLAEDLDRYLNGNPIEARRPNVFYRWKLRIARRKAAAAATLSVAALLVMAAWLVPAWRSEATARAKWEERRLQVERARPHLEAGRGILQRMKLRIRSDYSLEDLKLLAVQAHEQFNRALKLSPDSAEALFGMAVVHGMTRDRAAATEALGRSIQADEKFAPAYLERVRVMLDGFCADQADAEDKRVFYANLKIGGFLDRIESDLRLVERYSKDYPQQAYAGALLKFVSGDHVQAAEALGRYLEREPEDARAHLWRGLALLHLDQSPTGLPKAHEEFTKALAWDTGDSNAMNVRARTKIAMGLLDEAIADMSKAVQKDPKDGPAYYVLGWAKLQKRNYDEAIQDFSTAIDLKPPAPGSLLLRGAAKAELGRHTEAIDDFTKAINLRPRSAQAYSNRGESLKALRRYELAMQDQDKAIEVDPAYESAYINRGNLKALWLKDKDGAIQDFNKALEFDPRNARALFGRGVTRSSHDPKGAIQDLGAAIDIDPKFCLAHSMRGLLREGMGNDAGAMEDYDKAIELDAADPLAYGNRCELRRRRGDLNGALEDGAKAIELDPKNAMVYCRRGGIYFALKKYSEAIDDYDQATKLDPKNANTHYFRGFMHLRLNDAEKGLRDLETALQLFTGKAERANAAIGIAWGQVIKGDKAKALDWLERAVELGFRDVNFIDHYLGSLRDEERYKSLIEKLKQK